MFLLRESDRPVAEICFDVGFSSPGTFSRTFRAIVGMTPGAYRKEHGPVVTPHCVQLVVMRPAARHGRPAEESTFG
jgi:AraC-like DNA-binding protein